MGIDFAAEVLADFSGKMRSSYFVSDLIRDRINSILSFTPSRLLIGIDV